MNLKYGDVRFPVFLLILTAAAARAQVPASTAAAQALEAAPAAGSPTLAVQDLVAQAKLYKDAAAPGLDAAEKGRRLAVRDRLSGILDLREMARRILAPQWGKLKPAEREKYSALLSRLVEKAGYPQIEKYFNGKLELLYEGEKPLDGGVAVLTRIVYKEEDLALSTEFHLHRTSSAWRVYDVVTDGDSLLLIYRNQHLGIIKDKGFVELVRLMEKKADAK